MSFIERKYVKYCEDPSDINEHLPILYRYASECRHITECGVRGAVSSYAFANALRGRDNRLIMIDLTCCDRIEQCINECEYEGVNATFYEESDLTCPIEQTDLLFIDTWHIYGQLKMELARWNAHVGKYIIMHDTTVDGVQGESVRMGWNIAEQSKNSGIAEKDICKGLWPAVEEFLVEHPEWVLKERLTNNNGLTVLARRS